MLEFLMFCFEIFFFFLRLQPYFLNNNYIGILMRHFRCENERSIWSKNQNCRELSSIDPIQPVKYFEMIEEAQ